MRRSVATPAPFATRFDNEVGCGHVTTESHRVALGLNGGGLCWGEAGGALRCVPDAHLQTTVARWFSSNAVLLSGGSDTILKVWDAEEEMEEGASLEAVALLSGQHKTGLLATAMVGRGRTLVSGSRDCVALWDVSSQKALRTLGPGGEAWSLECLADETAVVAGGAAGQGRVLDLREARAASVALSTSAEAGALLCCQQEGDVVQFGTERGWLVHFDLRRPDAPVVHSRRADEARILCLFRGGFATSLGSVVRGTTESQVAEVGQPIVAVDAEGRVAVATDKIIFV